MPLLQTFGNDTVRGYERFGPLGAPAAFELITTTVVSGSAVASVTFNTSALSTYKHLQIRWVATETAGGDVDSLIMRFNGDNAANYAWHDLRGLSSSGTPSSNAGATSSTPYISFVTGTGTAAARFGAGIIDVLDFGSTSKTKTSRSLSGAVGATDKGVALKSTLWNNSSTAITSIVLSGASGNLDIGSRFSLYGLR